jgi:FkbM family methyltransferase
MAMRSAIESLLVKTPGYSFYKRFQLHRQLSVEARRFWEWTEADELRANFYRQFINPGDLVFDVGANLGNRTKVFCKLGAQVIAFEPQAGCYELLKRACAGNQSVRVLNRALAKTERMLDIFIADAHTISSCSSEWIEAVKKSGRFEKFDWNKVQRVETTTLDKAIQEFGLPSFIKIDVEGYEFEVLSGLSAPVKCISVEFTPELIQNTFNCIDHMSSLSDIDAQLSLEESMEFETGSWLSAEEIKRMLAQTDPATFGDVYIRCPDRTRDDGHC